MQQPAQLQHMLQQQVQPLSDVNKMCMMEQMGDPLNTPAVHGMAGMAWLAWHGMAVWHGRLEANIATNHKLKNPSCSAVRTQQSRPRVLGRSS